MCYVPPSHSSCRPQPPHPRKKWAAAPAASDNLLHLRQATLSLSRPSTSPRECLPPREVDDTERWGARESDQGMGENRNWERGYERTSSTSVELGYDQDRNYTHRCVNRFSFQYRSEVHFTVTSFYFYLFFFSHR